MKSIDVFVDICKEFVARVDAGEVHSRYTYNRMKLALAQYNEEESHPMLCIDGPFPGRKLTNDETAGVTKFVESKFEPTPTQSTCPFWYNNHCDKPSKTR